MYDYYSTDSNASMRNFNGMGDYYFFMTASEFKVGSFGLGPDWTLGYNYFHCGFVVCKSHHNTSVAGGAESYWSHRNRWLAGNA